MRIKSIKWNEKIKNLIWLNWNICLSTAPFVNHPWMVARAFTSSFCLHFYFYFFFQKQKSNQSFVHCVVKLFNSLQCHSLNVEYNKTMTCTIHYQWFYFAFFFISITVRQMFYHRIKKKKKYENQHFQSAKPINYQKNAQ